jgi:protein-tyrosine phosphatase
MSDLWPGRSELQEICPRVFISNFFGAKNKKKLEANRITHVLVCAAELPFPFEDSYTYLRLDLADDTHRKLPFSAAFDFIRTALEHPDNHVLVHCAAGSSRSGAICVGWLMKSKGWSCQLALENAQKIRPLISPNPGFMEQLTELEALDRS